MRLRADFYIGSIAERHPPTSRTPVMSETSALSDALLALLTSARTGPLLLLLATAAAIDSVSLRIPNWLTGAGALAGLLVGALLPEPSFGGLLWSLGGLAIGLFCLLPLYALGLLGAGDVKLMAMAGAFLGAVPTLQALLFVFVTAGAVALVYVLVRGAGRRLFTNLRFMAQSLALSMFAGGRSAAASASTLSAGRMPFAVSVGLGVAAFLAAEAPGLV
jgi:prepilin peptidase CpaA